MQTKTGSGTTIEATLLVRSGRGLTAKRQALRLGARITEFPEVFSLAESAEIDRALAEWGIAVDWDKWEGGATLPVRPL